MNVQPNFLVKWERICENLELHETQWEIRHLHVRCLICCSTLRSVTLKDIRRHTETAFHIVNTAKREERGNPTEQAWELCSDRENPFYKEVCDAFLHADIALDKLNNLKFV